MQNTKDILNTDKVIRIIRYGNENEKRVLLKQIYGQLAFLITIANKLGYHTHHTQSAFDEALIALEKNILSGSFSEGNFAPYFKRIFWNKLSDTVSSFYTKVSKNTENLDDFWLLPIQDTPATEAIDQGYKLILKWFDQNSSCQRDRCRELCSLKIETDFSTKEMLDYLDQQGIRWDNNTYESYDDAQIYAMRNQRLRDRIAHCWQRLRAAAGENTSFKKHILSLLSQ